MKIFGIVISAIVVAIAGIGIFTAISMYNLGVNHEENIDAQLNQNQNKYSEFTQSAIEQMGIAQEYKNSVSKVIQDAIQGRYGNTGSNSFVQAMHEAYPAQLDSKVFTQVMDTVAVGRREFSNEQKMLISKVQSYRVDLRSIWSGFWLKLLGYPKIDLTDTQYSPIINSNAKDTFDTGVDKGIKF